MLILIDSRDFSGNGGTILSPYKKVDSSSFSFVIWSQNNIWPLCFCASKKLFSESITIFWGKGTSILYKNTMVHPRVQLQLRGKNLLSGFNRLSAWRVMTPTDRVSYELTKDGAVVGLLSHWFIVNIRQISWLLWLEHTFNSTFFFFFFRESAALSIDNCYTFISQYTVWPTKYVQLSNQARC